MRVTPAVAAGAVVALLLAGCSSGDESDVGTAPEGTTSSTATQDGHQPDDDDAEPGSVGHTDHADGQAPRRIPLRSGESFLELAMPEPYTPSAPTYGTDDYRCFLLDPELDRRTFVTGVDVRPGHEETVHHVILFRVEPDQVAAANAMDSGEPGQGWTCFGGTGLSSGVGDQLDGAPWLGAWAPGGGERVMGKDIGIALEKGSRVIMQVHYNLLAGQSPDVSAARLRVAAGDRDLKPLETMLLPAPVELPCRPGHEEPLCDREAAVRDVIGRFGDQAGQTVAGLQFLCGGDLADPPAGPVQRCDRNVLEPAVVRAAAGHMHLLGRSITIELNPGRADHRTLLRIRPWNFDEQGAVPLAEPARIGPGDVLRVTCRHSQGMRDLLPALADQPERYVVWGEGTTDEMCLGIVMLTRD